MMQTFRGLNNNDIWVCYDHDLRPEKMSSHGEDSALRGSEPLMLRSGFVNYYDVLSYEQMDCVHREITQK
jgi:hypothetical protein